MIEVSEYDKFDYDYSTYWTQRVYENLAEKNVLNKIFSKENGKWFLDIGGSYGRLASTYAEDYKNPVIVDYSLKTLQKNKEIVTSKYPNIILIAANAYHLPFKKNVFDAALMVRVLHHIKEPEKYYKELREILKNDSLYVQEFANKIHIKATLRALFKLDFAFFNKEVYEQPIGENLEGSKEKEKDIFLNYHPKHIREMLSLQGFNIKKRFGCSFLRSPFIKKLINQNTMIFFEKFLQNTLSWTNIPPSIIFESKLQKKKEEKPQEREELKDILACPKCKSSLEFENSKTASCTGCSNKYFEKDGIWDFRIT